MTHLSWWQKTPSVNTAWMNNYRSFNEKDWCQNVNWSLLTSVNGLWITILIRKGSVSEGKWDNMHGSDYFDNQIKSDYASKK